MTTNIYENGTYLQFNYWIDSVYTTNYFNFNIILFGLKLVSKRIYTVLELATSTRVYL